MRNFGPACAEIPACLCGSPWVGGGSSARKSIGASPRLLFIRTRTLCILQTLCLPELVVVCESGGQKSPSALPISSHQGSLSAAWAQPGGPEHPGDLSSAELARGSALSHSCAHTSGAGMCRVLMTWFCRDCCQRHGFLLYVLKANNP